MPEFISDHVTNMELICNCSQSPGVTACTHCHATLMTLLLQQLSMEQNIFNFSLQNYHDAFNTTGRQLGNFGLICRKKKNMHGKRYKTSTLICNYFKLFFIKMPFYGKLCLKLVSAVSAMTIPRV